MKKTFLHTVRLVTFLIALQILNLDFFIQDFEEFASLYTPVSDDEDNDDETDSVIEYVSKVVLKKIKGGGHTSNKPNKHLQAHKHGGFKMIELRQLRFLVTEVGFKEVKPSSFIRNYHYQFCKEISPPPPKA